MSKTQNSFKFKILKKDSKPKARVGEITTAHGVIETPSFVAVGTQATVKGLSPKDIFGQKNKNSDFGRQISKT